MVAQLMDLRRRAAEYARRDGQIAEDEYSCAEQNTRLVRDAEQYYRAMFGDRAESWNLHEVHMVETLEAPMARTRRRGGNARAVVWAHNSQVRDARATQMADRGEVNHGRLVRRWFGRRAFLIGFTTHTGAVTAARDWDGPAERLQVRPSGASSDERLFRGTGAPQFVLRLDREPAQAALLLPRFERWSLEETDLPEMYPVGV